MKTKKKLIAEILGHNVHHNIRISFAKMPDYDEADTENGFNWTLISGDFTDTFKESFEDYEATPENDSGNRNLHGDNAEKERVSRLKGEIWQSGRMGATLYWDAYYNESGRIKYDESDLKDKSYYELSKIANDLIFFDEKVDTLMSDFYAHCKEKLIEIRKQKDIDEANEADYQDIKARVLENGYLKRLINDLI